MNTLKNRAAWVSPQEQATQNECLLLEELRELEAQVERLTAERDEAQAALKESIADEVRALDKCDAARVEALEDVVKVLHAYGTPCLEIQTLLDAARSACGHLESSGRCSCSAGEKPKPKSCRHPKAAVEAIDTGIEYDGASWCTACGALYSWAELGDTQRGGWSWRKPKGANK